MENLYSDMTCCVKNNFVYFLIRVIIAVVIEESYLLKREIKYE